MDPITGALIMGGGQLLANRQTAKSTARQISFQERMSNTAHQRQVKDLRAAGINPILSAKLGGASTPQGASYTAQNIGGAAVQGYQSVSSAKQSQAQAEYTRGAQTQLTKAQQNKIEQEIKQLIPSQAWNLTSQAKAANAGARLSDARSALTDLNTALVELDERSFKLVTRELGIPVGPQSAKTTIEAWKAASKNLDQLGDLANWAVKNIPFAKRWKGLANMVRKLKGAK
jgi:hypothetical protein